MALSEGYFSYINSEQWYRKRERWLEMADYECEWCSKHGCALHVHHLNYANFMYESDNDVIVLCPACHKHADIIRKLIKGRENEPLIRHILEKRGYPFDMKLKSRRHVIKLKKDLKRAVKMLSKINNLSSKDKAALENYLKEVEFYG